MRMVVWDENISVSKIGLVSGAGHKEYSHAINSAQKNRQRAAMQ
jgi:hypothetical protein